jgi:hypothetical protein
MDEQAATQPSSFLLRPFLRVGLILSIAVVAIGGGTWSQRIWIAEKAIVAFAERYGIGPVSLTIKSLDIGHISVSDIQIGGDDGQRIETLEAGFTISGLLDGVIESVTANNIDLRGRLEPHGLFLAGIPKFSTTDKQGEFQFPIRSLHLKELRIAVQGANDTGFITGNVSIKTTGGGTSDIDAAFDLQAQAFNQLTKLRGNLTGTRLPTGEAFGHLALSDGAITDGPLTANGIQGVIQFIVPRAKMMDVDARLDVPELSVAGETLRHSQLSFAVRQSATQTSGYDVEAYLKSRDGTIDIDGTLSEASNGQKTGVATIVANIVHQTFKATVQGDATATIDTDGGISATIQIDEGNLSHDAVAASGIRGSAEFDRAENGELEGRATATVQGFTGYGIVGKPSSLAIKVSKDAANTHAEIDWDGGSLTIRAQGSLQDSIGFSVNGTLDGARPPPLLPDGYNARGTAAFELAGKVQQPFATIAAFSDDPMASLSKIDARGWIESDFNTISIPLILSGGKLAGRIDLEPNDSGWRITTKKLRASAATLSPALLERIPTAIRKRFSRPLRVTIKPAMQELAVLQITPQQNGISLNSIATLQLAVDDADLSFRGNAQALLDRNGKITSFGGSNLEASLSGLRVKKGRLNARLTVPAIGTEGGKMSAAFQLAGSHEGPFADAFEPAIVSAKLNGHVGLVDTALSLSLDKSSAASVDRLKRQDSIETVAPIELTLSAPTKARIDISKGLESLTYDGAALLRGGRVRFKTGDAWEMAEYSETSVDFHGARNHPKVSIRNDLIAVPAKNLKASGVSLDISVGDLSELDLAVAELSQDDKKPLVIPLQFTASARQTEGRIKFEAKLFDLPERISIQLSGAHDMSKNRGTASVDAQKITFLPSVLQPSELFPIMGRVLREVDGEIDALAKLEWEGETFESSLELLVTANALKSDEFSVENATAVIQFDNLFPLSTPAQQEINIGMLDVGIPLLNGRAEFQLKPDGRIHGSLRELDFFGGRIETEEFTIPKTFDGFTVPLLVNGAALEDLLQLVQPKDLTATGTLNGRIPIVIENGAVAIREGVLESAPGGGHIRYRPDKEIRSSIGGANEGMALLLQIVDDFEYETARVALDEDAFGDVAFRFQIKGRNLSVYKGIPVHLNVSMDGPLRKILNQGLKSYTLPERILSRIQEFKDAP